MFADIARQVFHILHGRFRKNSVAKIKDVACAPGGAVQYICRARLDLFPFCEQQYRIEISLDGASMAQALPTFVERDAPVESDDIRACFFHCRQERGAVGAEINYGYA